MSDLDDSQQPSAAVPAAAPKAPPSRAPRRKKSAAAKADPDLGTDVPSVDGEEEETESSETKKTQELRDPEVLPPVSPSSESSVASAASVASKSSEVSVSDSASGVSPVPSSPVIPDGLDSSVPAAPSVASEDPVSKVAESVTSPLVYVPVREVTATFTESERQESLIAARDSIIAQREEDWRQRRLEMAQEAAKLCREKEWGFVSMAGGAITGMPFSEYMKMCGAVGDRMGLAVASGIQNAARYIKGSGDEDSVASSDRTASRNREDRDPSFDDLDAAFRARQAQVATPRGAAQAIAEFQMHSAVDLPESSREMVQMAGLNAMQLALKYESGEIPASDRLDINRLNAMHLSQALSDAQEKMSDKADLSPREAEAVSQGLVLIKALNNDVAQRQADSVLDDVKASRELSRVELAMSPETLERVKSGVRDDSSSLAPQASDPPSPAPSRKDLLSAFGGGLQRFVGRVERAEDRVTTESPAVSKRVEPPLTLGQGSVAARLSGMAKGLGSIRREVEADVSRGSAESSAGSTPRDLAAKVLAARASAADKPPVFRSTRVQSGDSER